MNVRRCLALRLNIACVYQVSMATALFLLFVVVLHIASAGSRLELFPGKIVE